MQISIDHQFLVALDLGHLDDGQQRILIQRIYDVLAMRVGHAVAGSLTTAQRERFENLIENDPAAVQSYLEQVVPSYGIVVNTQLDFIARSIAESVRLGTPVVGDAARKVQDDA